MFLLKDETVEVIANALREKSGSTEKIKVNQIDEAIKALEGATEEPFDLENFYGFKQNGTSLITVRAIPK